MNETTQNPSPDRAPGTYGTVNEFLGRFSSDARGVRASKFFAKLITLAQVLTDFFTVLVCFYASYSLYTIGLEKLSPQTFKDFMIYSMAAASIYIFVLDRVGLYQREVSLLNIKELRGIFRVGLYAAAAILSLSFYVRSVSFSRIMLTTALVGTPVFLYLERQIFYQLHLMFHQRGWAQTRVFIYGAGNIGTHLARRLFESPTLGLFPVGFLDDDESRAGAKIKWNGIGPKDGVKILGGESLLKEAIRYGVGHVLIALPSASFNRNQALVETCVAHGLDYSVVPNAYEKFIERVELYEIGGIPLLRRRVRQVSWVYLVAKRIIDLAVSALVLIVLSPFIIIFGLAIKMDSQGPIIFKQKRVGLRGREFSFYKFRTMRIDADKYARSPNDPNDSRITQVGRWLRRTSLDELPQLFNVLRGDMSLVGPRPEMPFIVKTYSPLHALRLEAKPGITGVWQISAVRGEPIHANIEYDLFYLENRSLLLDFAVLVKTALSVIRGIGAV